ncbi:hypothetical protein EUBVEN_00665 [Eubacterium ventriosum ATCC 27560]|uniref:Uncharacterized protein n=1 Tax=Eubacterium ventriosum ATCC 27560 TaxID=411463 RepID=A5Z4N8_9FIRM|nr:hypothetical protein EUBVEN_00665 [Eubacterium ventriosum ATCC 27560]
MCVNFFVVIFSNKFRNNVFCLIYNIFNFVLCHLNVFFTNFFYKNVFGIHCFIFGFVYLIHYLFDIFFTNFFSNNVFNLISYICNLVNSFISYIFSFSSVKGNCDFLVAIIVIAGVYLKDFFVIKIFKAFIFVFFIFYI